MLARERRRQKKAKDGGVEGAVSEAVRLTDDRQFAPLTAGEMEAKDRALLEAPIDPDSWDSPPHPKGLSRFYWEDPEPDVQGMLSADRIRAYNYLVGRMIRPFQEAQLKPASYELTLGPRFVREGTVHTLTDEKPYLVIPPNSIVYASMREMMFIPHWLVARFDLAIDFIYEGLLLGTGPQVDPGFQGVLSCPLHNISSREIRLTYKKSFAKIDFVKTSFGRDYRGLDEVRTERDLYQRLHQGHLSGYRGESVKLWSPKKNFRRAILFQPYAREVKSSVRELDDRVSGVETRVARFRNIGLGGGLAVVALFAAIVAAIVGVGAYSLNYTDGKVSDRSSRDLQRDVDALTRDLDTTKSDLNDAVDELRALSQRVP